MWFKNIQCYRFGEDFEADVESLEKHLSENAFVACGSQEATRSGFVPPLGRHGSEFVHQANGYLMLCSKRQDKLLPAAVVNEALEEKILQFEESEMRKMPRKQRQSLKEEITFGLLPRAFARSSLLFAYISPKHRMLVIDASSTKRAEEFISSLRDALGSLSLKPLLGKSQPVEVMTQWVNSGKPDQGFTLGEECELRDNADISCVIRCKNQDLSTSEIVNHLKTGMHVSKLALNWQQRIECVIDEKFSIKRLRFSDIVQEQASDVDAEDVAQQFDQDFSIMALELSAFLPALIGAFGGMDDDAQAA